MWKIVSPSLIEAAGESNTMWVVIDQQRSDSEELALCLACSKIVRGAIYCGSLRSLDPS